MGVDIELPLHCFAQALTNQNGFYQSVMREKLWLRRRLVVRDKESGMASACVHVMTLPCNTQLSTGEFYDDFSGPTTQTGTKAFLTLLVLCV